MSNLEKPNTKIIVNEFGILEYLKYIPQLIEQNNELLEKVRLLEDRLIPKYNFTKRATVKSFLEISDGTLNNMIKDGRFKQDIHYTKQIKGKRIMISFIEDGILAYKKGLK